MTDKPIEMTFSAGDQIDLEHLITVEMIRRATEDIQYAIDNPLGEFYVRLGDEIHGVQWTYVGLEPEDYEEVVGDDGRIYYDPIGKYHWEYGGPDFEISGSWLEGKV
ncbi:hypothetical protein CkP1_0075 [Citrobacter phage CkP1]|nr:hypothetical protein CkP1_0075 [Citrobacter phage CkP1]